MTSINYMFDMPILRILRWEGLSGIHLPPDLHRATEYMLSVYAFYVSRKGIPDHSTPPYGVI